MDVLSEILRMLRLRATVFLHACFYGDWAVDTSGERRATFHIVARGGCWLHVAGQPEPIALAGGDLIVFPRDAQHTITNSQQPLDDTFPRNQVSDRDDGGPGVTLVCGYFDFERHRWNPLIDALPDVMIVRDEGNARVPLTSTLGHFLICEVEAGEIGADLVVDKLSEILFTYVIRNHLQTNRDQGFIAALADIKIGKALSKIHEAPAENWTVERLAKVAGMSRSGFAERFSQLVKISPMQYLSRWRMTRANELFLTTNNSVAQVAGLSGYDSEVAFAKAFKKYIGYGPGEARKKKNLLLE
ncbi:MAG: AraC family transcriptional regulator [Candidatus Thiodiazotropha sp. (ex Troendleina suluensis)]|nr:AraC family transcriptional regulator [Candidatus Thiodiazotropha sp. (ex Troendleina suluensis)]